MAFIYLLELYIVVLLISVNCTIPGIVLILQKNALISFALTHATPLGIVLCFLFLPSPPVFLLYICAILSGLITLMLAKKVKSSLSTKEDSAIGILYLLSLGLTVLLITRFSDRLRNISIHSILFGNLLFSPLNRFSIFTISLGSSAIWILGLVLIVNIAAHTLFLRSISLSIFDRNYAIAIGINVGFLDYLLLSLASLVTVTSFQEVGIVLVLSMTILPASCAILIDGLSLRETIFVALCISLFSSSVGLSLGWITDFSIPGTISLIQILIFLTFLGYSQLVK